MQQEKGSSLGASCYLPSFGCTGGSVGPHGCVPRVNGSHEWSGTELGEERGGRASLKHLGSQTRRVGGGRLGSNGDTAQGCLPWSHQNRDSAVSKISAVLISPEASLSLCCLQCHLSPCPQHHLSPWLQHHPSPACSVTCPPACSITGPSACSITGPPASWGKTSQAKASKTHLGTSTVANGGRTWGTGSLGGFRDSG